MCQRLFDLHCDTAVKLFQTKQSLKENHLHISLAKASAFPCYRQIMAIWSDDTLNDEQAFQRFLEVSDNIHQQCQAKNVCFPLLTSGKTLPFRGAFLAVEDARILAQKTERLQMLYDLGVRFLTLVWGGISCIGGAHDITAGLTPFGMWVTKKCFSLGIVPDISHASVKTADEIFFLAHECGKPVIASHSNSFAVCPHSRNLRDSQFLSIKQLGGIVGICLCPAHLATQNTKADVLSVLQHIEHFYALGGEDCLALGCDFDGTELPVGFSSIKDLSLLAEELSKHGYSDLQIEKLFSKNAEEFVKKNI